ncbi:MAG: trehalose-phosphatase [Thermoanaerobaculia bacterium]|nr:trehalose-phosphatase [Thermoanaerobaculia bacterium]MCZ7652924.1 trehalose-phosphatase [Thermoanaerobaculia bacterium]
MEPTKSAAEIDRFLARSARAAGTLLLLDYDGTLAPFRLERERAVPYPGVRERLARAAGTSWLRIAVVSGRPADEVAQLLGLSPRPEIFGGHGSERLSPDGRRERAALAPEVAAALDRAAVALAAAGLSERVERKTASVAVHFRGLGGPYREAVVAAAERELAAAAAAGGSELLPFAEGLELRAEGVHKGRAVAALLGEVPPGYAVAYLGDDHTDEDAFAALPPGGLGLLVADRPRPSRASAWLRPPGELLEFLDRLLAREEGR